MNKFITIENDYLKVIVSTLGAGIYQIYLKSDREIPVLVTHSNPDDYLTSTNYYGKSIGRISGRLFGPFYTLKDQIYTVECHKNSPYMLHGGKKGIYSQTFEITAQKRDEVALSYLDRPSTTFPGDLFVHVLYRVTGKTVHIEYRANSTEDTLCNLTNHAYFNLNIDNGTVLDHQLLLNANTYNVIDDHYRYIKQADVMNTPFDFKQSKQLRNGVMGLIDSAQKGLDHCFILNSNPFVGRLYEPKSNRSLTVYSDYPSVVIYTHNFISKKPLNTPVLDGVYSSITFECQYEPDGIHHTALNSAILKKNEPYHHFIDFEFEF